MPSPRLIAVITALCLMSGGSAAQGVYTFDILREIEGLILAKDCAGLRDYLAANPRLMTGTDPLARELRSFAQGVDTGLIDCLSAVEVPVEEPEGSLAAAFADPY